MKSMFTLKCWTTVTATTSIQEYIRWRLYSSSYQFNFWLWDFLVSTIFKETNANFLRCWLSRNFVLIYFSGDEESIFPILGIRSLIRLWLTLSTYFSGKQLWFLNPHYYLVWNGRFLWNELYHVSSSHNRYTTD
jgi:hypothetical protein